MQALTVSQITGDSNPNYLIQQMTGLDAVTPIDGPTKPTILGADFYSAAGTGSKPTTGQSFYAHNTLFHEFLHAYLAITDTEMIQYFGPNGLTPYATYSNSVAISAWLSTDCNSTLPYFTWINSINQTP